MNMLGKIFSGLEKIGPAPRRFLSFLVFNVTSWECLLGSVLILHARALGIAPSWVGVLTAIIPFTMLITLLMKPVAERYGSKWLMIRCWTARIVAVSPIVFTPLAYAHWGTGGAAVILFSSVALYCLFRSLGSIGWMPWIHEIVPETRRGLYTGIEAMVVRIALILLGPVIYLILGEHPPLWKFSAVSAFGILLALISLAFMRKIPGGGPHPVIHHSRRNHLAEYRQVLSDPQFRPFFMCAAAGTFAYMGYGLLVMLYMREQLQIAPGRIMLITSAGSLATALTVQRWGHVADTHGSPATMASSSALVVVCLLLCTTLQPGILANIVVFPVVAILGLATAGFTIASGRGLLHRAHPDMRNAYSALWTAGTSVFSGLAAILTGFLLNEGTSLVYLCAFIGFAILMGGISLACLKLPESGIDHAINIYPLFLPRRPVISMLRMYSYILRPATVKELNPAPADEYAF
jgi:MFS family permease